MLPRIISATGAAITADEITAANRVVCTRSNQRAGIYRVLDESTGVLVEFHAYKNTAYTTPGGATDYVAMTMPNPVPYRGVSLALVSNVNYVSTSDGTILASDPMGEYAMSINYRGCAGDTVGYSASWSGGDSVWEWNLQGMHNDHKLNFTVPDDCVYPTPLDNPVAFPGDPGDPLPDGSFAGCTYYPGADGLYAQFFADWQAGIAAFNARRQAWFKKNSDELIAALKTGFASGAEGVTRAELQTGALPASWDYRIKIGVDDAYSTFQLADNSYAGRHTKMPIMMSITSDADTIVSDTSGGLTQAGVTVTKRTTTFEYIDAEGITWSVPIDGYLTQVVTQHTGGPAGLSQTNSYSDWYEVTYPETSSYAADPVPRTKQQFIRDRSAYSLGSIWNGTESGVGSLIPVFGDTTWRDTPLFDITYLQMSPPWPVYSNTLVGTAPDIYLQYHNTVTPEYVADTAQSSTVMNNSAMYGVTEVHISPVGLVSDGAGFSPAGTSLGAFSADEDGTQVEIYGTAVYKFNWKTGSLTFKSWKALHDVNGTEIASKVVALPVGSIWSDNPLNCIITYKGLHWPDVIEYVKSRDADAKVGAFVKSDPIWWATVQAVKAG